MAYIDQVLAKIETRDAHEKEFLQAVHEVLHSVEPLVKLHPEWEQEGILERIVEPERIIMFKVPWFDDSGRIQTNRGYRIQFNSALGPFKGGLRFHPTVNLSILKFLGFEQIFKNALTGLPLGGAKGGSDFDPKGKSDNEIMRFCQSFMTELYRHIGPNLDVPAGDIGVGSKEIGFLFGQYKRLRGQFEAGTLTGKGIGYGGSLIRKEATGYGLLYFIQLMLENHGHTLKGSKVFISGSGNVAIYAAEKAIALGAHVLTMSDSTGAIYDPKGIDLELVKQIKEVNKGRIKDYLKTHSEAEYIEGSIYQLEHPVDVVLACATQNEISLENAKHLVKNGCYALGEGANMPTHEAAVHYLLGVDGFLLAPGKAANAGGVAVSGLEMSQNSQRLFWSAEEVDQRLKGIMSSIHQQIKDALSKHHLPSTQYVVGANLASFERVVQAMRAQGDY